MEAEEGRYEPTGAQHRGDVTAMVVPITSLLVVRIGLVIWVVALVLVWIIPTLSSGDRSWWRWVPVAALAVGLLGQTYVLRGRGNAKGA